MRIDDLNRALQTHDTAKTDAVGSDRTKAAGNSAPDPDSDSDSAKISPLAANALDTSIHTNSTGSHDARVEMLRLRVERGEYNVSAQEVAASIIDQHMVD